MLTKTKLCNYPIKYLQDETKGILTGDLVLMACGTGGGKSTTSRLITQNAIYEKCPCVLYSLEDEIGTFASDSVYREYVLATGDYMNFREWLLDITAHPEKYDQYKRIAADKARKKNKDGLLLQVVHEMNCDMLGSNVLDKVLASMREEIKKGYRLFVLDHLDVLVPSERPADMVHAITELWRLVSTEQIALITFSQLASGRNKDAICPSLDDIRGSKSKVQTPTIIFSMARDRVSDYSGQHEGNPTFCRLLKNRQGGNTSMATIFFDKGHYTPYYISMSCNESGTMIDGMYVKDFLRQQANKNKKMITEY